MSKYAAKTDVSVEKSKMEIEATVRRYGADAFASSWEEYRATIQFRCRERYVRFVVNLPSRRDTAFTQYQIKGGTPRTREPGVAAALFEQYCRQKWRALALLVKAKLEAVDAGIATFEESFFADIVMPDGRTVYESAREQVAIAYEKGGSAPSLLLGMAR